MLKAITLYEPWASLMAIGAKRNETRGCRTTHRGDIAIHVAKTDHGTPESLVPAILHAYRSRKLQPDPNTFGCIIAVVDLYDVQPTDRLHDDPKARLDMASPPPPPPPNSCSASTNAADSSTAHTSCAALSTPSLPRLPVHRLDRPGGC